MASYRYLIVGGGMTADAACRGIRDHDSDGSIGRRRRRGASALQRARRCRRRSGRGRTRARSGAGRRPRTSTSTSGRRVVDARPRGAHGHRRRGRDAPLRAAAAGDGRNPAPPARDDGEGVVYYRTLDDYRRLRELAGEGAAFDVIGGGFIGSEIAAALAMNGCTVTIVFPEDGIGARLFPAELAAFVNDYYREHGVEVLPASSSRHRARRAALPRRHEERRACSRRTRVVAGLGIEPNTELAEAAGLAVDDGIVVDERGRAGGTRRRLRGRRRRALPGAGARRPTCASSTRITRTATVGRSARTWPARTTPYDHLPFFYSDLFELGYEAVGEVDSRLETVAEWNEPNRKGVVCYVDEAGRPRGFLLWDVWGKVDPARELIRAGAAVDAGVLRSLMD